MTSLPALKGMEEKIEDFLNFLENNEKVFLEEIGVNKLFFGFLKFMLTNLLDDVKKYRREKYGVF